MTAPAHDNNAPAQRSQQQPPYIRNPQTTAFCELLHIPDVISDYILRTNTHHAHTLPVPAMPLPTAAFPVPTASGAYLSPAQPALKRMRTDAYDNSDITDFTYEAATHSSNPDSIDLSSDDDACCAAEHTQQAALTSNPDEISLDD